MSNESGIALLSAGMVALFLEFRTLAPPLVLLLAVMILDYATGLMAASHRNLEISSYRSINGIFKKFCYVLLVVVGLVLDCLVAYCRDVLNLSFPWSVAISVVLAVWLIVNEIISILENIQDITGALPSWLLPLVKNIRSKVEATAPQPETEDSNDE